MGSIFVTQPDRTVKGFMGKEYKVPFYLQFVAGYVVEVVHSSESLRYNGVNSINTIIALPHATDKVYKTRASAGEEYRYYPLLRTMNDVPSKGDPVLLCTIGKIKYYLGPLNTDNNNPTWNDDPSFRPEILVTNQNIGQVSPRGIRGESPNFNKENEHKRLIKFRKEELDTYGNAVRETTGDTIIEGRHGNSLRIGSRSDNPYVFLSNERKPSNDYESLGDGSLISITSNGTLAQHFPSYVIGLEEGSKQFFGFQLSSDTVENNAYPIGVIHSDLNNGADIQDTIYGYSGNQMLLHSDRITLNSKLDDIFVSSIKDIHIGAGRHISIGSFDTLNLMSSEVLIGNRERAFEMQPLVLGDTLKEVLTDIINLIPSIVITTQLGPQSPMPQIQKDIQKITSKIDTIVSEFHKIEGN